MSADSSIVEQPPAPIAHIDIEEEKSPEDSKKNGAVADPFAPQVCLDADGNIVLDETSLEVGRLQTGKRGIETMRRVDEEAGIYGTTYTSFRRQPRHPKGARWTQKDNTRFYRALSTIGTDFYCMTKIFPCRTRTQLMVGPLIEYTFSTAYTFVHSLR